MKEKMKKSLLWLAVCMFSVLLVASFSLAGCKAGEPEVIIETVIETVTETVEVKVTEEDPYPWVAVDEWIFPSSNIITGVSAYHGMLNEFGANIALEEINSSGGIAGKPAFVKWFDEGTQDATRAVQAMSAMLDMDPLVVLGPCSDVSAKAAVPMCVEEGVYSLCTLSGYAEAREFTPWTSMFITDPSKMAIPPVKEFIDLNPGMEKIVHFIASESATWMFMADSEDSACEEKGVEVVRIDVPYDTVDYGSFAIKALAENPDGFIFTSHPEGIAKIIIALQDRGWDNNNAMLLSQAAPVPDLWTIGEGHLEGVYCWMWYDVNSDSPKWQNIVEEHQKSFGEPATFMMVWKGYDELYMMKDAIETLKITGDPAKLAEERIAIRDYLNDLKDFDGVFGPVDFTDGVRENAILLFKIENNLLSNKVELEPLL